jgi:hypothetical protein
MVVSDLRLVGSTESRLAFACTATHLASAFTYRPAALVAQQQAQAARQQQADMQEQGAAAVAAAGQIMPAGSDPSTGGKTTVLGPSLGEHLADAGQCTTHVCRTCQARMILE